MMRLDAARGHAEVIKRVAVGDWADVKLVGQPVSKSLLPFTVCLEMEVAVAILADGANPKPTARTALDLRLEPLDGVAGDRTLRHTTQYTENAVGRPLIAALSQKAAA